MSKQIPSMDQWLREAKALPDAPTAGMYLTHNGVVRCTAKAVARQQSGDTRPVRGMLFHCNGEKLARAVEEARRMPGVCHVRAWVNEGELRVGDDLMYVLVGGDIRPNVIAALEQLLSRIKGECVTETEIHEEDEA